MINGMIKKEQGLQDEVTFAVCKAIGLGVKQFAESHITQVFEVSALRELATL